MKCLTLKGEIQRRDTSSPILTEARYPQTKLRQGCALRSCLLYLQNADVRRVFFSKKSSALSENEKVEYRSLIGQLITSGGGTPRPRFAFFPSIAAFLVAFLLPFFLLSCSVYNVTNIGEKEDYEPPSLLLKPRQIPPSWRGSPSLQEKEGGRSWNSDCSVHFIGLGTECEGGRLETS